MIAALIVLQILVFAAVLFLLVRKPATAQNHDPRHAELPDQITRLHGKHDALDINLRSGLSEVRRDASAEAISTREGNNRAFFELRAEISSVLAGMAGTLSNDGIQTREGNTANAALLRKEVLETVNALGTKLNADQAGLRAEILKILAPIGEQLTLALEKSSSDHAASSAALRKEVLETIGVLGAKLNTELANFRTDNQSAGKKLHDDVCNQHEAIVRSLSGAANDARMQQEAVRDALHKQLEALDAKSAAASERLLKSVQERLDLLNSSNTSELEKMRQTVDEKLHTTLQTRLTESFGQVATHLGDVQRGLGEMKELAKGVGDLKKVFSNVKSRGVSGEFLLQQQLEQMFSPEQFIKDASIKPNSREKVDFALKVPAADGSDSHVLLSIDAKFPKESWEHLEHAYDSGSAEEIAAAGKDFERAIKSEGKSICEKYIYEPVTLPHAIMFLPTESLYAEVVRRPGLMSDLQQRCNITVAGPSTFMAIITSFRMAFHTLAVQKQGDKVWKVLARTKDEFGKFGVLMTRVETQVGTVQNTLRDINKKTTTINRSLKDVSQLTAPANEADQPFGDDLTSGLLQLVAAEDGTPE